MRNLTAVLDAAGLTFADVVKTTIYLAHIEDFAAVNGVYASVHAGSGPRSIDVRGRRPPQGRARRDRGDRATRLMPQGRTLGSARLTVSPGRPYHPATNR